jgi:type II secretion system protein H
LFRASGFTLMELIVVMTIITLLTAAVVPIYQGSLTRIRQDRATRDFVAYLKYAQERAITDATEYRFYLHEETRRYWVMRLQAVEDGDKEFAFLDEGAIEVKQLPEGIEFERPKARFDKDRDAHFVAFYSTGACDYATITLETTDGDELKLETKGRLGRFEVTEK